MLVAFRFYDSPSHYQLLYVLIAEQLNFHTFLKVTVCFESRFLDLEWRPPFEFSSPTTKIFCLKYTKY